MYNYKMSKKVLIAFFKGIVLYSPAKLADFLHLQSRYSHRRITTPAVSRVKSLLTIKVDMLN